jgi:phenylacetate-CoA ligase
MQQEQLRLLLNHAMQTVPYYQQTLAGLGYRPGQDWDDALWSALPILKRQQVQEFRDRLQSQKMPEAHGKAFLVQSSGSTGRPVQVLATSVTQFYWNVSTLRDNLWQQHDFMQRFAAVRPDRGAKGNERILCEGWGTPVDWIYQSVPTLVINSRVDVQQQLRWLEEYQPVYLLSLPSNLRELLRLCEQQGVKFPQLQQVRCFGETVPPALRDQVREVWGVGVSDMYSSQEVGYMALQCPDHEHYHVQSETMYLEVLDDNDQACAPGEIGRVVVTPLHNFAMPLIRYEGEPCPCGRGLPVLKRVVGRTRNMVRTPEGKCYWPSFPVDDWLAVAEIRQIQLRQTALDSIEVVVAMDGRLSEEQIRLLGGKLQKSLNYAFKLNFHFVSAIEVQKNGKYEDFISML